MTPFEFGQLMAHYTTKQAADPRAMMVSQGGPDLKRLRNAYNSSENTLRDYWEDASLVSKDQHQMLPQIGGALGAYAGLGMGAPGNSALNIGKILGTGAANLSDLDWAADMRPDYEKYVKDRAAYQSAGGKVTPKIKHPFPIANTVAKTVDGVANKIKLPSAAQVSRELPKIPRRPFVD